MAIRKGTKVRWQKGNAAETGRVEQTFKQKVTKNIEGAEITRFGKKDNKVLLIKTERGREYLKLENEVERDTGEM